MIYYKIVVINDVFIIIKFCNLLLIKMNRNVMGNITPRVVNYRNNGTSRDTYVSYNCGGYHV